MNETENVRPKRGWNNAAYEPKTHWPNKHGTGAHCGKRHGFYDPLKITSDASAVTCQVCKKAAGEA